MIGFEDENIVPKRDWVMLEPIHQTKLSLIAGIIDTDLTVPASMKAKVIRMGEMTHDPGFAVGDLLMINPHGGTRLNAVRNADAPDRLLLPVKHIIGVWEE